jgi:hypothetical protein
MHLTRQPSNKKRNSVGVFWFTRSGSLYNKRKVLNKLMLESMPDIKQLLVSVINPNTGILPW